MGGASQKEGRLKERGRASTKTTRSKAKWKSSQHGLFLDAVGRGVGFVGVHASLWNLDLAWICATCAHGYSEQGKDSVKVPRLPENMPSSQGCVSRVGMLLLCRYARVETAT